MATNYEAPVQVRELEKMLTRFTYNNGFEISRVFDDWLTYIIGYFSVEHAPVTDWKYKPEHNKIFHEMMIEWINVMNKEVTEKNEWFDAFGCLYEAIIASRSRASKSGQFFTPETLVELMTKITGDADGKTGKGLKVSDPTCGSGRTLLSFHVHAPGNYMYGEDIDRTCAMMTVCNFLIHGVVGEVVWHDSLNPQSYNGGWTTNRTLNRFGIPTIEELPKEKSFVWSSWEYHRLESEQMKLNREEAPVKKEKIISVPIPGRAIQLELF